MGRVHDTRAARGKAVLERQDLSGSLCSCAPFSYEKSAEPSVYVRAEGAGSSGKCEPGVAGEARDLPVCGALHQPIARRAGNFEGVRNHGGSGAGHALESGNASTGIPALG